MAENPLFEMGFPAPRVTAQEIDTLPSRLAQARGVQQAATQRAGAAIDTLLEPARQSADNAVGSLLEPVEQVLTMAGQHAAQTVSTAQAATVKALQAPLTQALRYGYVNQGTPVLSPSGRKTRRKKPSAESAADTLGFPVPPSPPGTSPKPPQPPGTGTVKTPSSYTLWFNCMTRDVAAVPNYTPDGSWSGWRPPHPWAGGYGWAHAEAELLPYLKQYGEQMFMQACPHYIPPG